MVEKILDKLKTIPPKILAWWNKFTAKQKTGIISVSIGVIVAFVILIMVVTRAQYVTIVTCENTTQASEVKDILDSNAMDYKVSDSGLIFSINAKQQSEANILLGSNNIMTDEYSSLDKVVSGGLSTTESDKEKMYVAYKENKLAKDLGQLSFVEKAFVSLNIPENDGTLISKKEDSSAQVTLKLKGECTEENAAAVARAVKTVLGNDTTDRVVIMDTDGHLLFAGDEESSVTGFASNQMSLKAQAEEAIKAEVKKVLTGTNEFDLVEVGGNIELDFSNTEKVSTTYTPAEGQTQGVLSHESSYESETDGGSGLVPGTDSNTNNNPTYVYESGSGGSATVSQYEKDYLPNTETTTQSIPAGGIVYDKSSIAVTAIKYKVLREQDAKSQGLLDGISWDEYKATNQDRTKLEVDEELYSVVSDASGIDTSNITIVAYEEPFFVDKEAGAFDWKDILQVGLILVILALLALVILRSLKTEKEPEEQPEELSVENLLQSMPDEKLDDIELETKSETRKLIEKFVEENPEAVANLLRNWLNEDWG